MTQNPAKFAERRRALGLKEGRPDDVRQAAFPVDHDDHDREHPRRANPGHPELQTGTCHYDPEGEMKARGVGVPLGAPIPSTRVRATFAARASRPVVLDEPAAEIVVDWQLP